ncbi:protein transporter Sec31 [Streptomyces sp. NPDC093544]|uniref:protein transporter Sec31 n=1 Tax=Streptomyces sp. NPDC093544 TaxID=3155200 RepID=UPI0034353A1C
MKIRSAHRTRTVPKTIDGRTHQVDETYTVELPVPPPDRDAQALKAVTGLAVLIVTGAIVWSTVAIGGLLSMAFNPAISYGIACVFDATWIGLMTLEWIARYDSQRASLPRRMGWAALVLSMALIAAHGAVGDFLWIGIAGAAVSLVAKSFWAVVMRTTEARLDPATAQWVAAERSEVDGQRALVAVRRQLERSKAKARDEAEALSSGGSVTEIEWRTPATEGLTEDRIRTEVEQAAERIRTAQSAGSGSARTDPDSGSVKDRVRALYDSGTTDPAAVVEALPDANPETVKRMVRLVRTEGGYA